MMMNYKLKLKNGETIFVSATTINSWAASNKLDLGHNSEQRTKVLNAYCADSGFNTKVVDWEMEEYDYPITVAGS